MESLHKSVMIGVIAVFALLFSTIVAISFYAIHQDTLRIKAGYEQVTAQGHGQWLWQKAR